MSLRHVQEIVAERGICVDHSTVHRWALKLLPVLEKAFRRCKWPVGMSWRIDSTYIRFKGEWKYLSRAVDKDGNAIDFPLRAHRDKSAARRYFERSIAKDAESPHTPKFPQMQSLEPGSQPPICAIGNRRATAELATCRHYVG